MIDTMKILLEACEDCECDCEDLVASDAEEELVDEYEDIDEIDDDDPEYTEEMIPVFAASNGDEYYIESDMLGKYMNSNNIYDPKVAIEKIAEANNIIANSVSILIESNDYAAEIIEEAKCGKSKDTAKKASATAKFLKNIKLKGIKVVKKKAKSNKKLKK